jgi:fimbrial chaperone protein
MRSAAALILALAGIAYAGSGLAGSFTVSPVRITLTDEERAQVVRLQNLDDAGALVQVEVFTWRNGTEVGDLEPTRDILAVPPIFEVGPQSRQIIRLALRKPLDYLDREASYRLLITEVPREANVDPQTIAFALQLNLPVFVTPKGAKPDPVWSLRRGSSRATELVLTNNGTAHIRIGKIEMAVDDDAAPLTAIEQAGYVLAGAEKSWPVDIPAGAVKENLIVRAETNLGELEATVALPGG